MVVEVNNPACGDIMRLSARFEDDRVVEVAFKTRGCTASIASGSAAVEWMMGRTRGELARVLASDVEAAWARPPLSPLLFPLVQLTS